MWVSIAGSATASNTQADFPTRIWALRPRSAANSHMRESDMFIGHYGPAFGGKAALRQIPLWVLFIAVQWMDVVWSVFVLTGIEKVRIVPGFTEASPLDLYYMPYTHGLG